MDDVPLPGFIATEDLILYMMLAGPFPSILVDFCHWKIAGPFVSSPLTGEEQLARARRPVEEVARNYVAWTLEIGPPGQLRDQKCC